MRTSIQISAREKVIRVLSGNFVLDDIKILLMELRDYLKAGSICREIGDFMAHPKGKDRGITHQRVSDQWKSITASFVLQGDGRKHMLPTMIDARAAFSRGQIVKDLNINLRDLKLLRGKDEEEKLKQRGTAISLCVVAILQDAIIFVDGNPVKTEIGFDKGHVTLDVQHKLGRSISE